MKKSYILERSGLEFYYFNEQLAKSYSALCADGIEYYWPETGTAQKIELVLSTSPIDEQSAQVRVKKGVLREFDGDRVFTVLKTWMDDQVCGFRRRQLYATIYTLED